MTQHTSHRAHAYNSKTKDTDTGPTDSVHVWDSSYIRITCAYKIGKYGAAALRVPLAKNHISLSRQSQVYSMRRPPLASLDHPAMLYDRPWSSDSEPPPPLGTTPTPQTEGTE